MDIIILNFDVFVLEQVWISESVRAYKLLYIESYINESLMKLNQTLALEEFKTTSFNDRIK